MKIIKYPDNGKYVINDLNETSLTYKINIYEDLFLLKSIKDGNSLHKISKILNVNYNSLFNHKKKILEKMKNENIL